MSDEPLQKNLGEEAEARYANYFTTGHNAYEVILEFGQFYEGDTKPRMHTRIVTGPEYARTFLEILRDSLDRQKRDFGTGIPNE
ncbi:MAG: DUF3467 domain-containing protein [Candidatus Sulfotelmatobacter sp.]